MSVQPSTKSFVRFHQRRVSNGLLLETVETPALILPTYLGNLLYSPPSLAKETILENDGPIIGQLELGDVVDRSFGNVSLHDLQKDITCTDPTESGSWRDFTANKFTGACITHAASKSLQTSKELGHGVQGLVHLVSGRSVRDGPALCTDTGASIITPGGRRVLTSTAYAQRIALDRPRIVVSFADEFPLSCTSKNRMARSVKRTMSMLQELVTSFKSDAIKTPSILFGVALAGQHMDALAFNSKAVLAAGAQGVSVGCVNQGEDEGAFATAVRTVRDATLESTYSALENIKPESVPVLVQGCDNLRTLLIALEQGVDLVGSNFSALLTGVGHALTIDWEFVDSEVKTSLRFEHNTQSLDGGFGSSAVNKGTQSTDAAPETPPTKKRRISAVIDLWDNVYQIDPHAIMGQRGGENAMCPCHACRYHSRAYIHHLLQAKELLWEVLLSLHNQAQLLKMFRHARQHAMAGTLSEWIAVLHSTYDLTDLDWHALQSRNAALHASKGAILSDD